MSKEHVDETLTEDRKKEIFLALVDAQDHDMSVAESRKVIADKFGISEGALKKIEAEGLDQQWPPL